jgi:hypothetical protein
MDPANLYREEVFTDRALGSIRRLVPVKPDGSSDVRRETVYVGQAQLFTSMGSVPLAFEIPAQSLDEAIRNFNDAANEAVERTMQEIEEMRREAASSIILPETGAGSGAGGVPGAGKFHLR